jgi:hypothetical protein
MSIRYSKKFQRIKKAHFVNELCFPKKVCELLITIETWNKKVSGAKSELITLPHF